MQLSFGIGGLGSSGTESRHEKLRKYIKIVIINILVFIIVF